jgi:hypothetical protein
VAFFKKLFGGADKPEEPADAHEPSPAPRRAGPSADPPPQTPPSSPPQPTLADLPPRQLHSYFEYVGGGSSKFYAVSLEEEDGGTWRVRFNFGRIGFPRAWSIRVEGAPWKKAAGAYWALVEEKTGKGYEIRQWPPTLQLPDGASLDDVPGETPEQEHVLFRAQQRGTLPPEAGGMIAGVSLPDGDLYAPTPEGGSRGEDPVIWASAGPVPNVATTWSRLAAAFPKTGIWPFVIDASYDFNGFDDYLMDLPRGRHTEVVAILRKAWNGMVSYDEDYDLDEIAPFGKTFPGLADPTRGERATTASIDRIVASLSGGHLGLVGLHRPADILDTIGWMGAVNEDGDPLDMSTVLRSWELRFDAYVVGMGTDTLILAVGRPPRDLASATAIAAEHFAFCPDNIQQGIGTIREYADALVGEQVWPFWWD